MTTQKELFLELAALSNKMSAVFLKLGDTNTEEVKEIKDTKSTDKPRNRMNAKDKAYVIYNYFVSLDKKTNEELAEILEKSITSIEYITNQLIEYKTVNGYFENVSGSKAAKREYKKLINNDKKALEGALIL